MSQKYNDLILTIFSRHQSVQSAGFSGEAYKPGLERMLEFDSILGRPSERLECVHIAGTNGKGSVSHMLASALASTGRSVGLYTSPHLKDFRERLRIIDDDSYRMISEDDVVVFLEKYQRDIDGLGLSFFEITTGMALWWFEREGVDVAVMEVGLGGRLDSTNIITPELSIVTSIGLDHCAILGDTREAIALEKAGIFKPGVPAVVGIRDDETAPVFESKATEVHSPLFWADDDEVDEELLGRLDLRGEYQAINLRTAMCALDLMGEDTSDEAIREALAHSARRTGLRGRWDVLCESPLTIADIGHNPPALRYNFAQLGEMMRSGRYNRLIIVYGVMADKDLDSIIPLMPQDAQYIFVAPKTPRALPSADILQRMLSMRPDTDAIDGGSVSDGWAIARRLATPDSIIYIGGSAFVVAEAL